MNRLIAPSLLSANFSNLAQDMKMLNESQADWIHLDVMDGVFVPNISFGIPIISSIRSLTNKPFDVHLMIVNPSHYFKQFKDAGADYISFHMEACHHVHRSVQLLNDLGVKAGVVLNPHSPVLLLEDIISELDYVLLMSVNPGFGGQKFIENTYEKIGQLQNLIEKKSAKCLIQVDGGVNTKNSAKLFASGADVLVAGNAVFKSNNPKETIELLKYS